MARKTLLPKSLLRDFPFSPGSLSRKILVALGIPSIFIPGLFLAAALGWDWSKDLSLLAARGGYRVSKQIFPKEAMVVAVLDGDTFQIDNDMVVRMLGIDAPDDGPEGEKATEALRIFLDADARRDEIELEYDTYQDDKYGRILAYVWQKCQSDEVGCIAGKRMVNWLMVKEHLAKVVTYEDRRKLRYEDFLRSAE